MGRTRTGRFSRGHQKAEAELNRLIHLIKGFSASLSLPVVHISTQLIWFSLFHQHMSSFTKLITMIIHPELTGLGNRRLHLPSSSTVGLSSACHLLTLNHICVNLQFRSDLIFNVIEQMLTNQGMSKLLIFACQCKSKDASSIKLPYIYNNIYNTILRTPSHS